MKLNYLHDLFVHELRDVYNAEKQIAKALPKMARAATSPLLKSAFSDHLVQTEEHIVRLERVFDIINVKVKGDKCLAMEGIIKEGQSLMAEHADPDVMDAGLIAAAQRVEHYEIAVYGTLCTYAKVLNLPEVVEVLAQTLKEEKQTDEKLTVIAESSVNIRAEEH